jgi:hypothetical protein
MLDASLAKVCLLSLLAFAIRERILTCRNPQDSAKGQALPEGTNMPITLQDLKTSRSFLSQAHMLVSAVCHVFYGARETDAAARLNEIASRLNAELDFVERLIMAKPGGEPHS